MGVPFHNSPTTGKDVIVRLEPSVIGGLSGVGRGWAMLMESLAAGRGISIPAQCAGEAAWVARVAGAYARVRRQFGLPIGRFEGVAEAVGKIGGLAYIVEALRAFTCAALNSGKRPAIVTAMVKYQSTELLRRILNHGMDVLGGVGLSLGPRNLLAHAYIAAPIAITVEGANILTRSLIVFGQGVLRLHPAIYREVSALQKKDAAAFDSAWTRHLLFAFRNAARGAGAFLFPRGSRGKGARRRLERASAIFAALSELTILTLGRKLKFSEKLSGRFADALGWMVVVCAVLHRYESDGLREEDRPFVEWSLERSFAEIQYALEGILMNHPAPVLGAFLRRVTAPLLRLNRIGFAPSDHQELEIAHLLMSPGPQRERLYGGIYLPLSNGEPAGRLEAAMRLAARAEPLEAKRRENLSLSSGELELIEQARRARVGAVQVDSFAFDEYKKAGKRAA